MEDGKGVNVVVVERRVVYEASAFCSELKHITLQTEPERECLLGCRDRHLASYNSVGGPTKSHSISKLVVICPTGS